MNADRARRRAECDAPTQLVIRRYVGAVQPSPNRSIADAQRRSDLERYEHPAPGALLDTFDDPPPTPDGSRA